MINFEKENVEKNAKILLQGMWYSELPNILDVDTFANNIKNIMHSIEANKYNNYKKLDDGSIGDMNNVVSPDYLRQPGVEPITYYAFKKDQSLREMQIPNVIHYISFIYNSLWYFENLFEKLYLNSKFSKYINDSNSYVVFGEEFNIITGYDECEDIELGIFASSNNKMHGNLVMSTNKERYESAAEAYRYGLKMDIESFFPNIYTHYFEKISKMNPFCMLENTKEYFKFLDVFHQRINNNQTKGIPAGIFSAHLASELLMLCIDDKIRNSISQENIGYIRYVDDLTFFSDSKEELQRVAIKVQKILNEFRLRINSNKNEMFSNAKRGENTNIFELERKIPWLVLDNEEQIKIEKIYLLKEYIVELLEENRISQIKTILTRLNRKIKNGEVLINEVEYALICYCQVLALENTNLTCHAYKIIDSILDVTDDLEKYLNLLKKKTDILDKEYEDTLLQIWHYYVLLNHLNDEEKYMYFEEKKHVLKNPIICSMFVVKGQKKNSKLFAYMIDLFKAELENKSDWKRKIMYSKWWLPVYKIWLADEHNYMDFMRTELFPELLKDLGQ